MRACQVISPWAECQGGKTGPRVPAAVALFGSPVDQISARHKTQARRAWAKCCLSDPMIPQM